MSFPSQWACRFRLLSLVIFIFLGAVILGVAQAAKVPEKQCVDYSTQSEMNDCASQEAKGADEALNSAYQELLSRLKNDTTATARMVAAEKAWTAFRDAELAADWPVADGDDPNVAYGSVHPFCYYEERASLTLDRLKTLRDRMAHEEEGNLCSIAVASMQSHHDTARSYGSAATRHDVPHVQRPYAPGIRGE